MSDTLKLIIANKKYSSWSLRPWIAMKVAGIVFKEELSWFDMPTMHQHFWAFSPTKKVPVLEHGQLTVWDSLAILEYLADIYPGKTLWPEEIVARAHARAISNEMHSGFLALRERCPMNVARIPAKIHHTAELDAEIARINRIWAECHDRYGGPFLFGRFTNADAMFAPVVSRFLTYQLPLEGPSANYVETITSLPAWGEWMTAGAAEKMVVDEVEI